MLQTVYSAGINGIDGFSVTVECNSANRLAKFEVVGLPDAAVKEARERIKAAAENSGYEFPEADITVNMAPADKKKQGSAYDLAIMTGILGCCGMIRLPADISDTCFIGELSLSGDVRAVRGVLSMCLAAREAGKKKVFVPYENAGEASVADGITVYGVRNVREMIDHLTGNRRIEPTVFDMSLFENGINSFELDFADVRGQDKAKRALEIAAAGGHNILMIGSPGTGKSMLAKRIPTILPPLSFEEAIGTTKLHSVAGILPEGVSLVTSRPFRSPHHTLSPVALAGGGAIPMPGEISLAHNGVLFLDELPEFSKPSTEVLRQPLEDHSITIIRASGRVTFPCSLLYLMALSIRLYTTSSRMVFVVSKTKDCPDRIDIQIEVPPLSFEELSDERQSETSADIRARVTKARRRAVNRYAASGDTVFSNAALTSHQIRKYCTLEPAAQTLLKNAFERLGLSGRGYDRILRVARTVADLDDSDMIKAKHIAEAIQLRSLDR
ncbi:MAG: magnesium chelatase, partial [Firmicutes bacterium CAG:272_52_7]